jgi:hypothetical protein
VCPTEISYVPYREGKGWHKSQCHI